MTSSFYKFKHQAWLFALGTFITPFCYADFSCDLSLKQIQMNANGYNITLAGPNGAGLNIVKVGANNYNFSGVVKGQKDTVTGNCNNGSIHFTRVRLGEYKQNYTGNGNSNSVSGTFIQFNLVNSNYVQDPKTYSWNGSVASLAFNVAPALCQITDVKFDTVANGFHFIIGGPSTAGSVKTTSSGPDKYTFYGSVEGQQDGILGSCDHGAVYFSRTRSGKYRQHYNGNISGNTINGTFRQDNYVNGQFVKTTKTYPWTAKIIPPVIQ